MSTILLTGAAGNLGRVLSAGLADEHKLRLMDIVTARAVEMAGPLRDYLEDVELIP